MGISRAIPSMFHRRLLLLLGVVAVPAVVMGAQLARLNLAEGGRRLEIAESKLVRSFWTPTQRGRILDRKGRILARDEPSYTIAVDYPVLAGLWAESRAGRYARARHGDEWPRLDATRRAELIERYKPVFEHHIELMWREIASVSGVGIEEIEQRRARIVARVESMRESITLRRSEQLRAEQIARGRELTTEIERRIERQASRKIREQVEPHALLPRVDDGIGFAFLKLSEDEVVLEDLRDASVDVELFTVERFPGLVVESAGDRVYPYETMTVDLDLSTLPGPIRADGTMSVEVAGVATQLLGSMSETYQQEDAERRNEALRDDQGLRERAVTASGSDRGAYHAGDTPGRSGVERELEHRLRGLRGLRRVRLDTGEEERLPPEPGLDTRLTIDIALQARIQGAMSPELGLARVQEWHGEPNETMPLDTPINGSAVVLEIDSGDVLALVSTPGYTRAQLDEEPDWIFQDAVDAPWVNRPINVPYQPGSIVKPLVLAASVTNGQHDLDERIDCFGHFYEHRQDVMRCWPYRERYGFSTHNARFGHAPGAVEALLASCNIYFYTLGQKLGPDGIADMYRALGVDTPMNLGVGAEHDGLIGPMGDTSKLNATDAIFMGIGQGPVAWTPLQAAESYATLARAGVRLTPRVLMDSPPPDATDLGYDPRAVGAALEGLNRAVNQFEGTGHHITAGGSYEPIFNADGVEVWGKTGTAQASPVTQEIELADGVRENVVLRAGDHSWFVILVGPEGAGPKYAVAVVMEHAGSGGKVSGPIANQIVHALIAEGYL